MTDNINEFCEKFNIVDDAMSMRTLLRWNGRDLRNKENLAEHTHLVVACAIDICEKIAPTHPALVKKINFYNLIKYCMLHDSLEMFRGDILSITKDSIPGLRDEIDTEEEKFLETQHIMTWVEPEKTIVKLADLMACYKFVEYELRFPSNDYMREVYITTKQKFTDALIDFLMNYGMDDCLEDFGIIRNMYDGPIFIKGYQDDAGTDIILTEDVVFLPMSTTSFGLKCNITPEELEMSFLCARTSAANKGLVVAMCPIDPNFNGEVTAIVHNVSNNIIEYHKGESFCQFVTVPMKMPTVDVKIKKEGKRSSGKLGSTGNVR